MRLELGNPFFTFILLFKTKTNYNNSSCLRVKNKNNLKPHIETRYTIIEYIFKRILYLLKTKCWHNIYKIYIKYFFPFSAVVNIYILRDNYNIYVM